MTKPAVDAGVRSVEFQAKDSAIELSAPPPEISTSRPAVSGGYMVNSAQSVSWWDVHLFVQRYLDHVDGFPMAGTPAWCALPDDDRRKWAAVLAASEHHVLRMEMAQEASCEASSEISAGMDWGAVARRLRDEREFYSTNPWLRRSA